MTTETPVKTAVTGKLDQAVAARLLEESYGPGAWHGPDLKAALRDVSAADAFWRPARGRHNVAEIALHHAWYARSVASQLSGKPAGAFPIEGEDWFALSEKGPLSWKQVQVLLEEQLGGLAQIVDDIAAGRLRSPLPSSEQFDLILGIASHGIYHAGQIQLVKVLNAG
jgi:hypothetical protein